MSTCGHCGANLTPADLSGPNCRYCGTALAHYAGVAEKVALVNALLGDANHNGIPDMFEGMARLGNAPAGVAPAAGRPMVVVHSAVIIGPGAPTGGVPPGQGSYTTGPGGASSQQMPYVPSLHSVPAHPSRHRGVGTAIMIGALALIIVGDLAGVTGFLVLAR